MRDEGQSGRGVRQRSALITGVACAAVAVSGIGGAWASETGNQTPSAAKLVTRNVHPLRTSIGSLIIFGEVFNRGTTPAADVGVGVGLLNDRGERLARGATLKTSVNILRPGKAAVWVAQMSDNPKRWKRMQFQVVEQIGAEAARKQDYPAFKVRGTRLAPPGFSQKVTGTVVNTGKKAAKVGAVTVALTYVRASTKGANGFYLP